MRFRVRPGFKLFKSREDMELFQAGGDLAQGVVPLADQGGEVELSARQLCDLSPHDKGKLKGLDADATAYLSRYPPTVADQVIVERIESARARGGTLRRISTGELL
jgi:hypothetical protein